MEKPKWEFWIDRGGTFTDLVARSPEGKLLSHKLLSESKHYHDAVIQGIKNILLCSHTKFAEAEISAIKMGTTVATNALLERKGERVVLAITKGFADALQIGYQNRPDLFALNIQLPTLVYEDLIEIEERIDAKGNILQALNEKKSLKAMQQAYDKGYRTIAIVLMHAYQFSQHEKKLKELAEKIGFKQISVSHEIAPVMKLISRGDTTVVDAYLSPVLQRYIQSLTVKLKKIPLFFMQSNGGLIHANQFKGKDSIFSGPAGGVIGMIKTAQIAGFEKVIGFDMGGTSTDVSHIAGLYERRYSHEFGGIRLRAPMMLIHTIAAGGGSVLNFDGQRLIVGPNSAGANPGPACYRLGGPLTISDCNLKLGKIQPEFFPKVFGAKGTQALDSKIVDKKFQQLTAKINQATGKQQSPEQIAEAYLLVAVESMANAIKKISIQRGYDVRQYLLNCFGGAGGQHACLVADNLGIEKILIHPLAGVLSAYGMGLADLSTQHELAIEKPLRPDLINTLLKHFSQLKQKALQELQCKNNEDLKTKFRVHLRFEGSDTVLMVEFGSILSMRKNFIEEHRQKFGFAASKKNLIVESVSLELALERESLIEKDEDQKKSRRQIPYQKKLKIFTHNAFHETPVYLRGELRISDSIKGPALICEEHSTTFVEPGWQALVTKKKHLLLTRFKTRSAKKISSKKVDPALLEVFNNRFMNIAEQMGEVLRKTASSVNIKERLDFSCAIFDKKGELVANAPHIPVHLGSMSETVKAILAAKHRTIRPKDVFVINSPYNGGTHLPDITVITPVFDKKKNLLFLVGSRGHHADIGGITPGSIPADSKTIEEEGVLINQFKIVSQGRFLEKAMLKLLNSTRYPARNPKQNIEDLKAQIAANARGVEALLSLVDQFDLAVVKAYMKYVRQNAKLAVEQLLNRIKAGHFTYSLDDGTIIKVAINIDKKKKQAIIDFSGSSAEHPGNFNAPTAISKAAVLYVLRCLVAENIPLNSGCFLPIKLIIPKNSLLNPSYPAAVVAGNVETSQALVDTLFGALGAVAASQGTCNNFTFGNRHYQYYETICGGAGAGPGFAGASAVHTHMTNTYLTDPEILEWRFPVVLEDFSIRKNSGGKGKYPGGDGVVRRIRFLEKMTANIISNHRKIPPYGLAGGEAGKVGRNWVLRLSGEVVDLGACAKVKMNSGDQFIIETPGGGGWGFGDSP